MGSPAPDARPSFAVSAAFEPSLCPRRSPFPETGFCGQRQTAEIVTQPQVSRLWRSRKARAPRQSGAICEEPRKSPMGGECVVVDAVAIEPVSSPNSLLTGKGTGNFCRIRPCEAIFVRRQPANSMPCREIPYATEQGIIGAITGNFLARTGSLSGRGQRAFRLHHRCNGRCRAGDAEASPSRSSLSVCPRRAQTSLACSALSQAQPAAMAAAGWSWCVSRFRRPTAPCVSPSASFEEGSHRRSA